MEKYQVPPDLQREKRSQEHGIAKGTTGRCFLVESRGKSRNRLAAGSPDPAVGSEVHAPDVFQPSDQAEKTDSLLEGKAAGAEKGQTILKDSPKRPDTFEQDVSGSPTEAPDGQIRTGYKPYGKWTILRPGMPGNNHIEVVIV